MVIAFHSLAPISRADRRCWARWQFTIRSNESKGESTAPLIFWTHIDVVPWRLAAGRELRLVETVVSCQAPSSENDRGFAMVDPIRFLVHPLLSLP